MQKRLGTVVAEESRNPRQCLILGMELSGTIIRVSFVQKIWFAKCHEKEEKYPETLMLPPLSFSVEAKC